MSLSPQQLLALHPTVREAVAWFELFTPLDELRAAAGRGLPCNELVEILREAIDEQIGDGIVPAEKLHEARQQMGTPEFAAYLTGRLGLV